MCPRISAADPATQIVQQIGVVDAATQWAGQIGVVDPATQWAGQIGVMDPATRWPTDRCHGSCYPMGPGISAADPATQMGPMDRCRGS
jgi:hypothetical protein